MKQLLIIVFVMLFTATYALPAEKANDASRMFSIASHSSNLLSLDASNLGYSENLFEINARSYLMFKGAPWISAKRPRRDSLGRLLYWLSPNPNVNNSEVVTEDNPLWNIYLKPVIDSLTTVGFEGDMDLYELLPAYNTLNYTNPNVPNAQYNTEDVVLKSILGWPAPREFCIPDPLGNYCYTFDPAGYFDTPGFETLSAYFYDYCPFNTAGDRDWGTARELSTHYPLGIAVHRESYAWPIQNYDKLIMFKYTIINTSEVDTLYDLAISEYTDNDIGPDVWGPEIAIDDVSGYVKGTGYEFAYARDFDGDNGLSPFLVGQKMLMPDFVPNRAAWYWNVGQGPNDKNPRNLQPTNRTSNEKYWLATGRNPNNSKYAVIRPEQNEVMQYEQPAPNDTRMLNTLFGAMPTLDNPNPTGRICIPPLESISYYNVYFVGNSIDDLKAKSINIENWIDSGFDLGNVEDLACIPYLHDPQFIPPYIFQFSWQSYSDPDHFEIKYKTYGAPASQWNSTNLPGSYRQCNFIAPDMDDWYEVKVAAVYNPGPNEVYLESVTKLVCVNNSVDNDDLVQNPAMALRNYPNPFHESTTIQFELAKTAVTTLSVYNLKGQKLRILHNSSLNGGKHKIEWDGKDSQGNKLNSGIYLIRMDCDDSSSVRKVMLLK